MLMKISYLIIFIKKTVGKSWQMAIKKNIAIKFETQQSNPTNKIAYYNSINETHLTNLWTQCVLDII